MRWEANHAIYKGGGDRICSSALACQPVSQTHRQGFIAGNHGPNHCPCLGVHALCMTHSPIIRDKFKRFLTFVAHSYAVSAPACRKVDPGFKSQPGWHHSDSSLGIRGKFKRRGPQYRSAFFQCVSTTI